MIDILEATTVEHAEFIKTWTKMSGGEQIAMTPPTTASSVPATAAFGVQRADSLPAPQGAPRVYNPRRATQAPQPAPPIARVLQSKRQTTRSPRYLQQPPPTPNKMGGDEFMRRSREFVRQTAEHIRSLPMPFGDRRDQTLPITEEQKVKEDKDLGEAFQVVQDNFGIAPGQYVPGLSLKSTTASAPTEAAAAEAARLDVSDFEQFKGLR